MDEPLIVLRDRNPLMLGVSILVATLAGLLLMGGIVALFDGRTVIAGFDFTFATLIFLPAGYIVLHWVRSRVELSVKGITQVSALNRVKYFSWSEIDSACTFYVASRGGRTYRLYSSGRRIEFLAPTGKLDQAAKYMEKMLEGRVTLKENSSSP